MIISIIMIIYIYIYNIIIIISSLDQCDSDTLISPPDRCNTARPFSAPDRPGKSLSTPSWLSVQHSSIGLETIRGYGHVRPACGSTQLKLEHDFNSWHSRPAVYYEVRLILIGYNMQLGVPPQVALSKSNANLEGLISFIQAIVCFPVIVC